MSDLSSYDPLNRFTGLAERYGFMVVADEVYRFLHYGKTPPPPMVTFAKRVPA